MSTRLMFIATTLTIALATVGSPPQRITAQGLFSEGCEVFNLMDTGPYSKDYSFVDLPIRAGETLTIRPLEVVDGTASTLTLLIDGNPVREAKWPDPLVYTFPADGFYTGLLLTETTVYYDFSCDSYQLVQNAPSAPFKDDRLDPYNLAQPVVVYCKADGSVNGLAIYKGVSYPSIVATAAEIAAVPIHPVKNMLIKQGNGVRLYRLTGGLLQINRAEDGTGKEYSFKLTCEAPE